MRRQQLKPKRRKSLTAARFEKGVAAAELGMAMPLLMLVLLGTVDFGRFMYFSTTVAGAARAGAQYASLSTTNAANTTGIAQAANLDAQDIGAVTVTSQQTCKCQQGSSVNCATGKCGASLDLDPQMYVQVTVGGTFDTLFTYPGIPSEINLSRTAMIRAR